jgi:hypothetical protein
MKGAITDIWYTSQYATEMSEEVLIFEYAMQARRQNDFFGTNVKSDLTAHNSQEMQF